MVCYIMGSKKQTVIEQNKCSYCGKVFVHEKSLVNHACVKKMRFLDKDSLHCRLAFASYDKFYRMALKTNKPKTMDNFINSHYYLEFVKFGRYLIDNNIMSPELFLDFCIKNGLKLKDWFKPSVYELYLRELNKKESPEKGVERTILLMKQWSDQTGNNYNDFFRLIEPNLFINYVKQGRISPWIIYNSNSGRIMLEERLNDDQLSIILEWIDPDYWKKKFLVNKKDKEFFKKLFDKEGI